MNKRILAIFLLALNAVIIFWAVSNQFVTFAQIVPKDLHYVVGDKASIDTALVKARSDAIEEMREFFGRPVFVLSGLTLFNLAICLLFLFRRPHPENGKK